MMTNTPNPALEDVLGAFSVEPDLGKETLERYLAEYPQYAEEIVDLSFELSKPVNADDAPWTASELAEVDAAWQNHGKAAVQAISNPFEGLAVDKLRQIATTLDVPRTVLFAFRERQVVIASVPKRFQRMLAAALGKPVELVTAFAQSVAPMPTARSYKSDTKPQAAEQITFEQLLIQTQVSEAKRQELLSEE